MDKLSIATLSLLLQFAFLNAFCRYFPKEKDTHIQADSIPRPAGVSPKAVFMNFGGDEVPVHAWVEYIGGYKQGRKKLSHLVGIRYYYSFSGKSDTVFYENLDYRGNILKIEIDSSIILPSYSTADLILNYNRDTIIFFPVLEDPSLESVYKNVRYVCLPSVSTNQDGVLVYNDYIGLSIDRTGNQYKVRFNRSNDEIFEYNICSQCKETTRKVSFVDKTDGKIYFIERECYLEPFDKDKVLKIVNRE
jgi:hypothetical protein